MASPRHIDAQIERAEEELRKAEVAAARTHRSWRVSVWACLAAYLACIGLNLPFFLDLGPFEGSRWNDASLGLGAGLLYCWLLDRSKEWARRKLDES